MFICIFCCIIRVDAEETKTCYYNDGKGNEGQFSYVKTNDGYEFGNQYAIYDGLRSTNWSYRKDENTQDVLAWSGYTIKEYFSKGQCAPYLIYFKANGLFTGDDSTEIFHIFYNMIIQIIIVRMIGIIMIHLILSPLLILRKMN